MARKGNKVTNALNGATPVALPAEDMAGWEIDLNIRVKERKQFTADLNKMIAESDETLFIPWLTRFIKAWPYEGNPADPASYDELLLTDLWKAIRYVTATFQRVQNGN